MKKLVIIPILILISLIFISCNNDGKNGYSVDTKVTILGTGNGYLKTIEITF